MSEPRAVPASDHGPALAVSHLTGPVGEPLIHDVNLAVERGRTHLVLGPIHSGKSLLMRHIVGLECAESGTITVDGHTYRATGEPAPVLRQMRTRIGVVFEGSALLTRLSVLENVELPLLEHTSATATEARRAARELLAEVGVLGDEDREPLQLGRLERRRVALARAIALRPPVVLLDEPTHGLDSHSAHELDETVARLQDSEGFALLIFSHEVRHAYGRAEQISVMDEGAIVAQGPRETLLESEHPVIRRLLKRRERERLG
ncbi:MAG TPA: ATP-binding cassette domain-containing protein [Gemmatimonadaceae bacterium]|nr:ATP-binding cassette domain-containing protein [Gemmatimonadaceae bacterium]